jgi:phosphoribosylformimino-5-aminoimidazole carboxamide ribonucleotide (ProFAR) isomerase
MAPFEIFPAVDVAAGKLARLLSGVELRTYEEGPVDAAGRMAAAGAHWIHFVDLDAALGHGPLNLHLLDRITALPGIRVQAGGGLDADGVAVALAHQADRAILGAAALTGGADVVAPVIREHGRRVGIGLDVRQGRLAPRGSRLLGPPVDELLIELARLKPAFVVYTDAERDGTMAGPDLEGLASVAEASGVPVVASGGVGSLADIRAIAGVPGVEGAVVGRALHDGAFTLEEALAVASGS